MAAEFENPPKIHPRINGEGYVQITPEQWAALLFWLEKFKKYTQENLP